MAGTGPSATSSITTYDNSICPKGWLLARRTGINGSYGTFADAEQNAGILNSNDIVFLPPYYFIKAGYVSPTTYLTDLGYLNTNYTSIWTSTAASLPSQAYAILLRGLSVNKVQNRNLAYPMRCVMLGK